MQACLPSPPAKASPATSKGAAGSQEERGSEVGEELTHHVLLASICRVGTALFDRILPWLPSLHPTCLPEQERSPGSSFLPLASAPVPS